MITFLASDTTSRVAKTLSDTFGLSEETSQEIVYDKRISGDELWVHFHELTTLTANCGQNSRCLLSTLGRHFFVEDLGQAIARLAGSDHTINNTYEVTNLQGELKKAISHRLEQSNTTFEQSEAGFSGDIQPIEERLAQIQNEWGNGLINDADIAKMLAQEPDTIKKPTDVTVHVAAKKQEGQPNTVRTLAYFPYRPQMAVSPESALDFLIGHMEKFPERTTLYDAVSFDGSHGTQTQSGEFNTSNTMVMQDMGIGKLTATFDTQINWYKLGANFGANANASMIRFSLIPHTSSGSIKTTAFEGIFITRPVIDSNGNFGILFELAIDFDVDVPLAPDAIDNAVVDLLMSSRIKQFCQEIGYHYLESLRGNE